MTDDRDSGGLATAGENWSRSLSASSSWDAGFSDRHPLYTSLYTWFTQCTFKASSYL